MERCISCLAEYPTEELLRRETDGQPVCEDCSGLVTDEDLSCCHDESG